MFWMLGSVNRALRTLGTPNSPIDLPETASKMRWPYISHASIPGTHWSDETVSTWFARPGTGPFANTGVVRQAIGVHVPVEEQAVAFALEQNREPLLTGERDAGRRGVLRRIESR